MAEGKLSLDALGEMLLHDYAPAIEAQLREPSIFERMWGREEMDRRMAAYVARLQAEHEAVWLAVLA